MKKTNLLPLITFFLVGCSGSGTTNYDGLWLIDKEISLAECRKSLESSGDENDDLGAGFMEGFTELICQTITGAIPVLEIENNQFSVSGAEGTQSCSIDTESSAVSCTAESDGIAEAMGQITIKDGMLNFLMSDSDESGETTEMLLVYAKK